MPTPCNILAAVVSPLLLWAGAAAVSVPIMIHLLTRRRFRRVRWAAMDFLKEANRQNRRRVRIEELILLALRCLAMLLAGAMLARLFVEPATLAALLGSKARTERIVVLDDSFSMGLRIRDEGRGAGEEGSGTQKEPRPAARADAPSGQDASPGPAATVFGRAKAGVERLARWLAEESPDDALTVLLTSRPERPLRSEAAVGRMDVGAFAAELQALAPSARAGDWPAAMTAVRQLLEARKGQVNAAVYVVSDFQQVDWTRGGESDSGDTSENPRKEVEGATAPRSPAAALADWAGRGHSLRIVLVDTGVASPGNLCLTAIEPQQAQAVAAVSARFVARVTNFGAADAPPGSLRVFVGDAAQPPATVPAVPAGGSVEVPVEVAFPSDGAEALTLEMAPDALPMDNSRALAVPVARALRVLMVNGEASADPYQDELFLMSVSLKPEGPQFSGNDLTVVDENELETVDLNGFHAVVLANVYRLTEESVSRLEKYAAGGGGVAVFLGDQVDGEVYNRLAYRDGKGLMPALLGEVVSAPSESPGYGFGEADALHPLMRRFTEAGAGLFRGVTTWRFISAEVPGGPSATASAPAASRPGGGADAAATAAPARVLLRYDDAEKHPAIIEKTFGDGRVVLVTTTADKEWTSLPDMPVFVVLTMELIQHLARPPAFGGEQLVGEPIRLPLDPTRYRPLATLKPPNYPDEPAVKIEAQPDAQTGQPTIHWLETFQPGLYRFELTDLNGNESVEQRAVNVDPRESDLRRADKAALLESMSGLPVEYVSGEELFNDRDSRARRELWPATLVLLLGVLMAEQFLAVWFGAGRDWRALAWGRRA